MRMQAVNGSMERKPNDCPNSTSDDDGPTLQKPEERGTLNKCRWMERRNGDAAFQEGEQSRAGKLQTDQPDKRDGKADGKAGGIPNGAPSEKQTNLASGSARVQAQTVIHNKPH